MVNIGQCGWYILIKIFSIKSTICVVVGGGVVTVFVANFEIVIGSYQFSAQFSATAWFSINVNSPSDSSSKCTQPAKPLYYITMPRVVVYKKGELRWGELCANNMKVIIKIAWTVCGIFCVHHSFLIVKNDEISKYLKTYKRKFIEFSFF